MPSSADVAVPAHVRKRLRRMTRRIPPVMGCNSGCSDCCSAAPWSLGEAAAAAGDPRAAGVEWTVLLDDRRQAMAMLPSKPGHERVRCPFVAPGLGCLIYDLRPLVCRLYGAVEPGRMDCPHGRRAARPLSIIEEGKLMAEYVTLSAEIGRQVRPPAPVAVQRRAASV